MSLVLFLIISGLNGNWCRINYLGFEIGYRRLRVSVLEVAYGSAVSGLGIGGTVFEYDYPGYVFLPVTFYLARPVGHDSGPLKGKFGGPNLFPWGYQYPAAVYLFARGSPLGVSSGRWYFSSSIGFGFEKALSGAGTVGLELGYMLQMIPKSDTIEGIFGAFCFNFASWAKAGKE